MKCLAWAVCLLGLLLAAPSLAEAQQDPPTDQVRLKRNYPNPFNPITRISYSIPNSGFTTLKIYDMLGREIQTLVSEFQKAGRYSVHFDASRFSSGLYFYKLQAERGFVDTKKMLFLR